MSDLDRLDALKHRSDAQSTRFGAPYAEALRREGRLDEAVRIIRSALEAQPRNVFGLVVLARCLRDMGHPEEAAVAVCEAVALDATDPTVADLEYLAAFAPRVTPERIERPMEEPVSASSALPARWREPAEDPAPHAVPIEESTAPTVVPPIAPPPIFVTETMAELYLQQGLPDRALAIYRELTARAPDDARLAARLAEVSAQAADTSASLASGTSTTTSASVVERPSEAIDALVDLPLLDDFDPTPIVEGPSAELWTSYGEDAETGVADASDESLEWLIHEASEPESVGEEPVERSAFDFSQDAQRTVEPVRADADAMLAGLSFDAIALPTPADGGWALELPERSGPSARDALRALASRPAMVRLRSRPPVIPPAPAPAARPTGRRTTAGATPPSRVASPSPTDSLGDDFDQWLRGVP